METVEISVTYEVSTGSRESYRKRCSKISDLGMGMGVDSGGAGVLYYGARGGYDWILTVY